MNVASEVLRVKLLLAALLISSAPTPCPVLGQDIMEGMALRSLRGLTGIGTVVVAVDSDLEHLVSAAQLQATIELELRRVGIVVGGEPAAAVALTFDLTALPIAGAGPRFAVSYACQIMQPVQLLGSEQPILAYTWLRGGVAVWGAQVAPSAAREAAIQVAGEFANTFLAANPPLQR